MEKDQSSLSHQDKMLMKNIKILLRDLSDMGMLKAQIKDPNNILEIRRNILLYQEKCNFNKVEGNQQYTSELVFEQLTEKSLQLNKSKSQLLAFVKQTKEAYER